MGNVQPFEIAINTQGNTQYFGTFSNLQRVMTLNTGGMGYTNPFSHNNLEGGRTNGVYTYRRRQGTSLIGLYDPPNLVQLPASEITYNSSPLVRIKLNNGYWCLFLFDNATKGRGISEGYFTSDTSSEATSGKVYGNNYFGFYEDLIGCNFGTYRYDHTDYVGVFFIAKLGNDIQSNFLGVNKQQLIDLGASKLELSNTFGVPSTEEGYSTPSFDNTSDIIPIPNTPSYGVSTGGMINVYSVTEGALTNIANELFPEVDYTDPLAYSKILTANTLINFVLDCHIIPVSPSLGNAETIKVGGRTLASSCQKVASDYVDVDCGYIEIGEYYNNFIDYMTTAKLYLPFVGYVPLKNEFFQNGRLQVKYRFNIVDGSFMAYVLATSSKSKLSDSVVATYSGVACVHIPITGANYASVVNGLVNGAIGVVGGIASGNVMGVANSALNVIASKPDMQQSNSYSSSSALLSPRKPYLLIERPVSNMSTNSPKENGLPLNVAYKLGDISGFTICENPFIDNVACTSVEKILLFNALTSEGVVL